MSREALRAILKGDKNKFDNLVKLGLAPSDLTEKEQWTYLHRALITITKPAPLDMIKHLVAYGIDVDAVDSYGNTALHYAVRLNNLSTVEYLVEQNANVNHVNIDGVSPLRQALLTRPFNHDILQLLIKNGADTSQKTDGGITISEFANTVARNETSILELFTN